MCDFYCAIIFMTILAMGVSILLISHNENISKGCRKKFTAVLILIITASVLEFVGELLDGVDSSYRVLHIIVKCMELSIAPLIPIVYGYSVNNVQRRVILVVLISMHFALQLLSAFCGFIYYVDANNVYRHGEYYWVYYVAYLAGFAFFVIQIYRYSVDNQNPKLFELIAIMAFTICGIVYQIIDSSIKIAWLTVAIGFLMFYIHYNLIQMQLDPLTGLFVRSMIDKKLRSCRNSVVVLFFDIDDFKNINDTYGHVYGDKCLLENAKALKLTFAKVGRCYRYGGDEFCVVMTEKQFEVDKYVNLFYRKIRTVRKLSENIFPNTSCGYAIYYPGDSVEAAIFEADKQMYQNKTKRKGRY